MNQRKMRKLRISSRLKAPVTWLALVFILLCAYHENLVCLADRTAPATTYRVDGKTNIKDIFKCSGLHFIGSFNEYYVACELAVPAQETIQLLEIVDVTLDGSKLSPLPGVHAELAFQLNASIATVSMRNSQLQASAVEIHAANVTMDEHSAVNVTARGLKFGPGYNSWNSMGGSYGGIGARRSRKSARNAMTCLLMTFSELWEMCPGIWRTLGVMEVEEATTRAEEEDGLDWWRDRM